MRSEKNRPGLAVTVLVPVERKEALAELLFEQTTTLGLRIHEVARKVLDREVVTVETSWGPIRIKVARRNDQVMNFAPEYEDCQRIAGQKSVPLKQVLQEANFAFMKQSGLK